MAKWTDVVPHVAVLEERAKGDPKVQCLYEGCQHVFFGGTSRIVAHFLRKPGQGVKGCTAAPKALVEQLQQLEKEKQVEAAKKRKLQALETSTKSDSSAIASVASIGSKTQLTIKQSQERLNKATVDAAAIKFFVANGIPFNVARNKYFLEFVQQVAKCPNYQPPNYNKMRTDLLADCVKAVKADTDVYLNTAKKHGCTITSDGWSNTQNRPLLNVLAVTATGAVFLSAVDTSGETKDAQFIADQLCKEIEQIGPENVVQVITDNATNCKGAGLKVEQKYPHITWTPCTAHCLDLFLEDIGKMEFMKDKVADAKQVVTFISNHHLSLAIFRQFTAQYDGLELLKPAETRFAFHFIMMQRLLKVKDALEKTVVSDEWKKFAAPARVRDGARTVRDMVLATSFWDGVQQVVDLVEPVVVLLRLCDGHTPCIGKVYNACSNIEKHIANSDLPEDVKEELAALWAGEQESDEDEGSEDGRVAGGRWNMLHSCMHAAGYALDPEFQGHDFDAINPEVMAGLMDVVSKLIPDVDHQADAMAEHAQYRQEHGAFGRPLVKASAKKMPAYEWWLQYGGAAPTLQPVAIKVLSQVSSACACERNWSTFDFVHSKRRNRLSTARASDLVYAFSNLRLIDKTTAVDFTQVVPEWGEDSDPEPEADQEGGDAMDVE